MAQVVRCGHCHAAWRVVADQLKVSDGWLRCSACGQPVDALGLRDPHLLPRDAALAPAAGLPLLQQRAESAAQAEVRTPSFMRAPGDRQAIPWTGRRFVRLLMLLLAAALGCVTLLWQRDHIALWSPQLGDVLEAVCEQLACDPHGRRNIDAIVIEQSDLLRLDERQYELQVTLVNASRLPVLLPALQLTLIDEQGNPLWQYTLQADELVADSVARTSDPALMASQSLSLRRTVTPELMSAPVSGYRLLTLYP